MTPVGKALWYIESHFASDLTLDEIAAMAGVSRYHMVRAFGEATGLPVMRYVRARRLTEAARVLANGAADILTVALDARYGSHEAFTRAFRDQFGLTPEQVRAQCHLGNIQLVEPIKMEQNLIGTLPAPRFETRKPTLIAGLGERYSCESSKAIPAQWQRFGPHIGHIPGQVGNAAYGVKYNPDDEGNFDYLCGVEVKDFTDLPAEFSRVRIPQQRYAVFSHHVHISTIRSIHNTIWSRWLPQSGHEVADAPDFEFYGEDFNPDTGFGTVEIWIPVKG
jgi:AraC family transcriptional regulator